MNVTTKEFQLRSGLKSPSLPSPQFGIYATEPSEASQIRGGLVLVQEIFGVNEHIRNVARHYASLGFVVWAPRFFDHIEPGLEFGYDGKGHDDGRALVGKVGWEQALDDVAVTARGLRQHLESIGANAKVGTIGYCWGGSVAWFSATRLPQGTIDAAVSYYGRHTLEAKDEAPRVPVIMHFGEKDEWIPLEGVRELARSQPSIPVHLYGAGHGFNCDMRKDFDPQAARLAEQRSLEFLKNAGFTARA